MQRMNPTTAIAPIAIVRRGGQKRWHIVSSPRHQLAIKGTLCGQRLRTSWVQKPAYNAEQITCDDCLIEAIRRAPTKEVR